MIGFLRKLSLPGWMLVAMVAGALFGILAPDYARNLALVPDIFLRLIKSIIAPVLFGVLVSALANSPVRSLGRLGWKSVVYFEVVSSIALLIGWIVCSAVQPGAGVALQIATPEKVEHLNIGEVIAHMFPASIIDAMARGDVLQITIFCLLFGMACAAIGPPAAPIVQFASAVAMVAFRYTSYVMIFAPAAVFASIAMTVAGNTGGAALTGLVKFVLAAWFAQTLYCIVAQGSSLWIARMPVRRFAREVREPFLVAFATTSSAAALPQTLAALSRLGIPERIYGVVVPLSLSFNASGSSIHLAMGACFVAQAAGLHLSLTQQILILATLKLTSKGVAGIPRANFVVLAGLFNTFNLPLEGLTILLGIDALIDPVRTSVNVLGHCAAPPVIARWESGQTARELAVP